MKIFNSIIKYSRILEEIDFSYNREISNPGLEVLAKNLGRNKGLKLVKLAGINLTDESCRYIMSSLAANKTLVILDL